MTRRYPASRARTRRRLPLLVLLFASTLGTGQAAAFPLLEPPQQVDGPIGRTMVVLDYDGDGFVDIAGLGNEPGSGVVTLTLRRGNASGFDARQTLAMPGGGSAMALAAGDVTGDGRDDLVAAFSYSATVVLIRGRADGSLVSPGAGDIYDMGTPTVYGSVPVSVAVADLDADDDLDVAAAVGVDADTFIPPNTLENGHVTIFGNDGSGGLEASATTLPVGSPTDLEFVPLAGDDDPDLVVAQSTQGAATALKIFPGAGGVSFGDPTHASAGGAVSEFDWGDFDDDGRADIVVGRPGGGSIVPGAATAASLGTPVAVPDADGQHILAGDLDRDGRDDLYVADGRFISPDAGVPDSAIFLRGLGDLRFGPRDQSRSGPERYESSPQIADIDGDGKPDVVTSGWDNNVLSDVAFIRYGIGPQLVPTPLDLDAGDVTLGGLGPAQSVTFKNIGPGTATAIVRDGDGDLGDFPVTRDTCTGATLAVDGECRLDFAFTPLALGERFAELTAYAPDADYVYTAGLFGVGVPATAPPPAPPPTAPPPPPAAPPRPATASKPTVTPTSRGTLLRRGLRFTQGFSGAGSVRWTIELPYGKTVLARATRTLRRAGSARVTMTLVGSGRRRFTRGRATRLVLRTAFKPTGATRASVATTAVRLRR